jgi:hypothetical protein
VIEDWNGCDGDHQTSDGRLWPASHSASTDCGKRIAFPMEAALGVKPCCLACVQKVVKSGGIGTPVTTSTFPSRNALIWAEKSSVRF